MITACCTLMSGDIWAWVGKGQDAEWMHLGVGTDVGEYSVKDHEWMDGNEMRGYRKGDWIIWGSSMN